jgi:hypothetical protein
MEPSELLLLAVAAGMDTIVRHKEAGLAEAAWRFPINRLHLIGKYVTSMVSIV